MSVAKAIKRYGLSKLASQCGVTPQATHKWLKAGVPSERVLEVERITGISRYRLRPDVYGDPPRTSPEAAAA